ncbi:MAG: amidohydrolase family protein [Casimicrobiaceae bacterium]
MDMILRNARVGGASEGVDIGFEGGRIAAIERRLAASGPELDLAGRFVTPPFCETHIHLDKSCILNRCKSDKGDLEEAIAEVAKQKQSFTADDVYQRACRTLEKAVSHGTMHMRTHVEVDPGIGLRGLEGVFQAIADYRWAIDAEVCVFPQEGLTNNPGTEELMIESMKQGARVVGAAPYTDTDPHGQIDRVFRIAREFDADIDMHLDFGKSADYLDIDYVCELTEKFGYGGRVAVGHVTKLTFLAPEKMAPITRQLASAGVAVTVLPSTDLYLMGRDRDFDHHRGVVRVHELLRHGVNCSLSTNNVLNPFTPFGDCSLIRMANIYANIGHAGMRDFADCLDMVTTRSARLLRRDDYGLAPGKPADLVVLDCATAAEAVAELAMPLYGFKGGRMSFARKPVEIFRP